MRENTFFKTNKNKTEQNKKKQKKKIHLSTGVEEQLYQYLLVWGRIWHPAIRGDREPEDRKTKRAEA